MTQSGTTEEWRPVVGHDGYDVSDLGNICSRLGRRPRLLKFNHHPTRHLSVHLFKDGRRTRRYIHHLVLEAFVGSRPEGMEACHNDGDPANNRLANLRWGTRQDNLKDRATHGVIRQGERHPNARLTAEDVLEIRQLREAGMLASDVAELFGISKTCVYAIGNRSRWAHV